MTKEHIYKKGIQLNLKIMMKFLKRSKKNLSKNTWTNNIKIISRLQMIIYKNNIAFVEKAMMG
jgi:hypothetical protein